MRSVGTKIGLLSLCVLALGSQLSHTASMVEEEEKERIDDWEFVLEELVDERKWKKSVSQGAAGRSFAPQVKVMAESMAMRSNMAADSIGFSVGGAKDGDNFFQNLKEGYLPRYSSLTYEGLFYDYTFDTGQEQKCEQLFCPSYARAVTRDIFSGDEDYYLTLGLNSGLSEATFQRKKLNLVVVLDISGSMSSPFNSYYYDTRGSKTREDAGKSKMEVANQSIVAMLEHLQEDDQFSMVLFDDRGYRAKPLRPVAHTDMAAITGHVLALRPRGGTNMSAGLRTGLEQFALLDSAVKDPALYENRIVFLTDAMPNRGELSKGGLFSMVRNAAVQNIYTTFIGIGVDFNPDLVEHITKTRGANYYAVHSSADFHKRLDDEFEFMVSPLVFDLELQVESSNYKIVGVFGSPEADLATGQIMKINTLFPSSMEEEEVRGGVVLVKLKKTGHGNAPIQLRLSYEDRSGRKFSALDSVVFDSTEPLWENNGIRKAVLLAEYVSLLKNWLVDSRKGCNDSVITPYPCFPYLKHGLVNPDFRPEQREMDSWEKRSCKMEVSEGYRKLFSLFGNHFHEEMMDIADIVLEKEMLVLEELSAGKTSSGEGKMDDWRVQ